MYYKTTKNLWEKVGVNMEEIVLKHNGIEYSKEELIKLLDLVFEIVGEEV